MKKTESTHLNSPNAAAQSGWRSLGKRQSIAGVVWILILSGGPHLADAGEPQSPADVQAAQQQRIDIMRAASAATVAVFGPDGGGGGSGVLITPDGYALTNYHVSSACGDFMRCGLNDGMMYDAVIVGVDAPGDVSLIKLIGRDDFPTAPLADSSLVRVGQWCFAAGNPFVLATNLQPSISMGIVSGTGRYQYPAGTLLEYADCIQTDAAINPGNSGGPLFNLAGEVIGINGRCSFEKRGRVNVGVGYAISSNQLKYFVGMLESGRLVDHATLGATVSTGESGRVLVSNILSGSDAYRRGMRYGDEIVALADREVQTTNGFKNILGTLPKHWRVPITVRRDGKLQQMLVRLGGVHSERELAELVNSGLEGPASETPQEPEADESEKSEAPDEPEPSGTPEEDTPSGDDASAKRLQEMFEARLGFANYHVNREATDAVWAKTQAAGDYAATGKQWDLSGTLAGEATNFSLQLSDNKAQLQIGLRTITQDFSGSASDVVHERRESGMLIAMRAMMQYLQHGPRLLGDTTYLGKLPVYRSAAGALSEQRLHPTFQSLWYDAIVRMSFDPETANIALIEVFGDSNDDPVELYLDDYRPTTPAAGSAAVAFPHRIRLQYGTDPVVLLQVDEVRFEGQAEKADSESQEKL